MANGGCDDPGRRLASHPDRAVDVLVALGSEVRGGPVDRADRGVLVLAVAVQSALDRLEARGVRLAATTPRA